MLPPKLPPFYIDPSSDTLTLPVGLDINGSRYRTVRLDEMTGRDEENMSDRRIAGNGAAALSILLRRVIQSIPGLVESKRSPGDLIDERIVRSMYQVDRDFLLVALRVISLDQVLTMDRECQVCSTKLEESVDLSKFPVYPWPEDAPAEIPFVLPRGITYEGEQHTEGVLRFPTGADQERIAVTVKANPGAAQTALFASIIKRLGKLPTVSSDMVQAMKTRDRAAISEAVTDNLPGLRLTTDLICSACGDEQLDVPLDLSLFFSRRKKKPTREQRSSSLTST